MVFLRHYCLLRVQYASKWMKMQQKKAGSASAERRAKNQKLRPESGERQNIPEIHFNFLLCTFLLFN